mmetsp:Transcript_22477/g.53938  ORF Transcript_22477/g.53938 Transcript_22477/m.53938 type:complete len:265 (-) Transcript_22477:205-999(-)
MGASLSFAKFAAGQMTSRSRSSSPVRIANPGKHSMEGFITSLRTSPQGSPGRSSSPDRQNSRLQSRSPSPPRSGRRLQTAASYSDARSLRGAPEVSREGSSSPDGQDSARPFGGFNTLRATRPEEKDRMALRVAAERVRSRSEAEQRGRAGGSRFVVSHGSDDDEEKRPRVLAKSVSMEDARSLRAGGRQPTFSSTTEEAGGRRLGYGSNAGRNRGPTQADLWKTDFEKTMEKKRPSQAYDRLVTEPAMNSPSVRRGSPMRSVS